nr:hypothetical protein [uncultured Desulfobacter sp.]
MKTTMRRADGERRPMAKSGVASQQKNRNGLRIQDNRTKSLVQQRFAEVMNSQASVQRQPEEEEELMQGKFAAQRVVEEDEDLLQGRFDPRSDPVRMTSS